MITKKTKKCLKLLLSWLLERNQNTKKLYLALIFVWWNNVSTLIHYISITQVTRFAYFKALCHSYEWELVCCHQLKSPQWAMLAMSRHSQQSPPHCYCLQCLQCLRCQDDIRMTITRNSVPVKSGLTNLELLQSLLLLAHGALSR